MYMDSSISGDICSRDTRDAISLYPFQRTFAIPGVGACPLAFDGHKTFCRQQHMGGALVAQDSRSMTTRFRGGPMHEVESPWISRGSHVGATPAKSVAEDGVLREVTLGDRRRLTVQRPWAWTHFCAGEAPAPRPQDTRGANFQPAVLGAPVRS